MVDWIRTIDSNFLRMLVNERSDFFNIFFASLTHLGDSLAIGGTTVVVVAVCWYFHKRGDAIAASIALLGVVTTVLALKELIHRLRPAAEFMLVPETGFSFPSAHAALSLTVYGFVVYLLYKYPVSSRSAGLTVSALLIGVIALLGFSRLYLGVHFLSDIAAGYALGALWLGIGIAKSAALERWFASRQSAVHERGII